MHKSLFKKYFVIISSIVLISFTVFGGVVMTLFSNFWVHEKIALLSENAATISDMGTRMLDAPDYSQNLEPALGAVARSIDGVIFIAGTDGVSYLYSSNVDEFRTFHTERVLPKIVMTATLNGGLNEVGNLNGFFDSTYYTSGVPLLDSGGIAVGAVFVSAPTTELDFFVKEMLRMILISLLLVLLVVFVVVYAVTARLVRPLRQMAYAAGCMTMGDFSKRVVVDRIDEIGELAAAFNRMTVALESLERMRRSFVANVSHELKTPMTTISGFIDGILDGTIPADKQGEYLKVVSDEIKRMSRMVTSMLSLSKLESGEMHVNMTTFDLSATLTRVAISFLQRIDQKQLDVQGLDVLEPVTVRADADLIHQVVYNLLDNAIKFTPEEGTISLRTEVGRFNVTVFIRNTGAGISPRELPLVFERFYKTDKSRSADKSGTGLGLYISKTIIGIHEGTISVNSKEGDYTEFYFTLPLGLPLNEASNEDNHSN